MGSDLLTEDTRRLPVATLEAAERGGLERSGGEKQLTDELLGLAEGEFQWDSLRLPDHTYGCGLSPCNDHEIGPFTKFRVAARASAAVITDQSRIAWRCRSPGTPPLRFRARLG